MLRCINFLQKVVREDCLFAFFEANYSLYFQTNREFQRNLAAPIIELHTKELVV